MAGWLLFQPVELVPIQIMDVIVLFSLVPAWSSVAESQGISRVMVKVEYTLGSNEEVGAMAVAETLPFGETVPDVGMCQSKR